MKFSTHPVWLVGFRPFFILACLSGIVFPLAWAAIFADHAALPSHRFSAVQWHAHEMFFGFGWAVIGGFLLTASKNWVQIRGHHGPALMLLVALWLVERIGMFFGGSWPPALFALSNVAFLVAIVATLLWTLVRHRATDSFRRDNYFFLLILPAFLLAKYLILSPEHFRAGWLMALGLFRVAFLVMMERTLTQFMKGIFQVELLRHPLLDTAIKLLAVSLALAGLMPPSLAATLSCVLALLLAIRFVFWKPQLGLRRLELAVMYLGYLAIIAQLLLAALDIWAASPWIGALALHVFTFGTMGLVIPAMLVRISKGHTGRKVVFEPADKLALWIMLAGFVLRIVLTQLDPARYVLWIDLSALCWAACFGLLAWRYTPFLLQARIDGKEH
ncbi:NnrS family protein [Aromatoleum buckelii]|uniref:NnrS family protein n=1 Tax=Aromatoleum buckelii TaxID=200254 RepID=A0ABX1N5Q9_9RHOO|nr:NnrS family protein [Aromatoleum buckelii]MCK0510977.1 NnrS family protein [Aromatoleum buckelii]